MCKYGFQHRLLWSRADGESDDFAKKMVTISRYRWGEMEEGLRFFEQDFSCKTTHQVWKTIVLGKWEGAKEFYDNF